MGARSPGRRRGWRRWFAALALLSFAIPAAAETVWIPGYWDARRKPEKPEASAIRVIRFLVDDEYPPFHYATPDGELAGFSVDLARALCRELKLACTIQARRWDTLADSLAEGRGDAIIAAMRITPELRARFRVTQPWHRSPARFVARKDAGGAAEISEETLKEKRVVVVAGSAHAAFLREQFPGVPAREAASFDEALTRLRNGAADLVFGDGATLALWLNGAASAGCCAFQGGPYLDSRYFGEGVGVLVRKDDAVLKRMLDYALAATAGNGTYAELYLKYFPVGFY
jgi:polar amino acid transport system substrate-binding protein